MNASLHSGKTTCFPVGSLKREKVKSFGKLHIAELHVVYLSPVTTDFSCGAKVLVRKPEGNKPLDKTTQDIYLYGYERTVSALLAG